MKKTLLALSVLVASTAANAGISLYDQDGVTVDMGGDIEVVYFQAAEKDASLEQQIQDADVKFDVRYAINDDLSVGAYWEFQGDYENSTEGTNVGMGDVFVAAYTSVGSFKVGDLCSIADDLGVGSDYQFGVSSQIDATDACGMETLRYDFSNDMFYASAAFRDNQRDNTADDLADLKVGVKVAGFDLMGYVGTSSTTEQDNYALEARYGLEAVNLEVGYYAVEDMADTVALAADYTFSDFTFAAGVNFIDYDRVQDEDVDADTEYFVNVGYSVAPGSTIYAEIGDNDAKTSDVGYAVGVKVEF